MNSRVLELLKNPKNIQSEDLNLLKEEINSFPYIQNIRALHLYGVHLYDQENYQKELSTTAAYTTDKKILYQLINGKIQKTARPEVPESKIITETESKLRYFPKSKSFPIKREELPEKTQVKQEESACPAPASLPEMKHVYINGERNRILFEGEENFLEENNHEIIDLESTLESGTIITQKQDQIISDEPVSETVASEDENVLNGENQVSRAEEVEETPQDEIEIAVSSESGADLNDIEVQTPSEESIDFKEPESEKFTPEEIINEDKITSVVEKEEVSNDSELSFHGTDSFMPEVKIESGNSDSLAISDVSQPTFNKHEDEMRRLIEEVEKKMMANKAVVEKEEVEKETVNHDINFAETQDFHPVEASEVNPEPELSNKNVAEVNPTEIQKEEIKEEVSDSKVNTDVKSDWKPMSFESHIPDSLINKPAVAIQPKEEVAKVELPKETDTPASTIEATSEVTEEKPEELSTEEAKTIQSDDITEENKEEAPVLNVSFFSSDISSWTQENNTGEDADDIQENTESKEKSTEKTGADPVDSNVPGFINTWQSWLKIDRTEKEPEKDITEIKNKVIESFIENNPKISQLKDESTFVVKEKNDDISHLMTETLAKLYIEQKLYTKAIKAFEILAGKHPGKKSYFEEKIQEVKDLRGKN
ncbi:hypothetical protein CEY12_13565 [Chryseobacterium sp. T16E-39]|uniref:hypothetical protein n=1 Tax=Chryseobacterium sp. T16E-39 TaxID=2015076 RepID=UPI000B5B1574|nr:hypothetical protein [Chryseobacterium sp. T16E-39]ASK31071.1 hypothetical protein CEY12_13565 [Chryseobacterium sp. T16E-39]